MTPVLKTGIVILLEFDGLSFEEKVHLNQGALIQCE